MPMQAVWAFGGRVFCFKQEPTGFFGMIELTNMLAVDSNATLIQRLLFHGQAPGLLVQAIWGLVLIFAVFIPLISVFAMLAIWAERKVAGHMQCRPGPNRVGPFGLLQSLADGVKLMLKEDLCPAEADSLLFFMAPYMAFVPVFIAFLALPFGPDFTFEPGISSGLFWILAVLAVEIMGVIMAGWSSNNKWAIYGAMREACQMVSYEIPLGISIIVAVMTAGTLNLVDLGYLQSGGIHTWLVFRNPFIFAAFVIYFIASLASNKRAPFDLPESESELVAGFHVEYSGMRWSFFFMAEYGAMFVVGAIQTALFLGGWNDPFGLIGYFHQHYKDNQIALLAVNAIASGIFLTKVALVVLVQMWLRWTLPRPRIDQVLYACVKVLLPLACAMLLGASIWPLLVPEYHKLPWVDFNPWLLSSWQNGGALGALITQSLLSLIGVAVVITTVAWIGHAWIHRGELVLRLTDPEPIGGEEAVAAKP